MAKILGHQIVDAVSGTVVRGDPGRIAIESIVEPREGKAGNCCFLISAAFVKDMSQCRASVLVVQESLWQSVEAAVPSEIELVLTVADAYLGLARLTKIFAQHDPLLDWDHQFAFEGLVQDPKSKAWIHPTAQIDPTARLSPGAIVCAQAVIGPRSQLGPNVTIGPAVSMGSDCILFPGVVLYPRTKLGDRVRLHSHVVLGSDGFGYAPGPRGSEKIWHLGRVVIGNDVEIGSGTCIDRGTLKDSIVEDGVKIDNCVQVGHNGHIKAHAILCAQVGLAGNVTVGRGAILAGQAGIADKIIIGDGAIIGPKAGISKDVGAGETMLGALISRSQIGRAHV